MVVLFDLDGTLIDSTDAIYEGFCVSFNRFDRESPRREEILPLIGYPLDVMFQKLGIEDSQNSDFVNAYKGHYRKIANEKTVLLDGAREAVELASSFAKLGIVTTKTARYSKELLEHLNIANHFEILIGREDVINPKPHPEPILKALSFFNGYSKAWMIGDTCMDIESANAAKIEHIAVTCGYATKEQLSSCAKVIKKDAIEAINFLKSVIELH